MDAQTLAEELLALKAIATVMLRSTFNHLSPADVELFAEYVDRTIETLPPETRVRVRERASTLIMTAAAP